MTEYQLYIASRYRIVSAHAYIVICHYRHRYLTDTGFETVMSRKHSSSTALLSQVFGSHINVLNVQNIYIGANGNTQAVGNSSYTRIQPKMYT